MPQFVEPRVVRLSWRRPSAAVGAPVVEWVERLKQRLTAVTPRDKAGRKFVIRDINEQGGDRAAQREGSWTDFVAVYTVDYLMACLDEGAACELHDALHRRDEPGHLLWLVRLEDGDPADFELGEVRPWHGTTGWQVVPDPDPSVPPLDTQGQALDRELHSKCIERLRATSPSPAADDPATPGG